ncbi:MAG: hypothetical protein VXW65_14590 [Pseudomonadota bacterium]|nr:hypothetical protein [Pseudomonadota bacterium]
MNIFLATILSFPTLIFTVLLGVAGLYLLVSLTGMLGSDIDLDADAGDSWLNLGGLMTTLGLKGVPLPMLITLTVLFAWLTSYSIEVLFGTWLQGIIGIVVGIVLLPVALFTGLLLTALLLRPFASLFAKASYQPTNTRLLGCACTILSPSANEHDGRAEATLDGAHLILQVRSNTPIPRGNKAIFVEYIAEKNLYWVVPEAEFLSGELQQVSIED